jgi:hypothetical protein
MREEMQYYIDSFLTPHARKTMRTFIPITLLSGNNKLSRLELK